MLTEILSSFNFSLMKDAQPKYIPYYKRFIEKACENRSNPTSAERKMWFEMLGRKSFQNLKFTRQKPVANYIVDFYCSELRLAIEIDGESHAEQEEYDRIRTKLLGSHGITVIRYSNTDVIHNLDGIFEDLCGKIEILRSIQKK